LTSACSREQESTRTEAKTKPVPSASAASTGLAAPQLPELLYLPDGGDSVANSGTQILPGPWQTPAPPRLGGRCPSEMVDIAGRFCIDRFEAMLVDARQHRPLSPYYHPTRAQTVTTYRTYRNISARGGLLVPEPPAFQLEAEFEPLAESRAGVVPSGYLNGMLAGQACQAAGKRLCTEGEWVFACRGQRNQRYPYGNDYKPDQCNVFRERHPAVALHGDASRHHLDPRLNLTQGDGPLLRKTGETQTCQSEWSGDAVYDMVGNLDEWIDDPTGSFVGGFYARGTREGCAAKIMSHPIDYFDYSLGVRCCR
jgi:hypothetical protein